MPRQFALVVSNLFARALSGHNQIDPQLRLARSQSVAISGFVIDYARDFGQRMAVSDGGLREVVPMERGREQLRSHGMLLAISRHHRARSGTLSA